MISDRYFQLEIREEEILNRFYMYLLNSFS